jgi:hypothetical protein
MFGPNGQMDRNDSAVTKNLDMGCNSWPWSAGHFVIMHPPFLEKISLSFFYFLII